MMLRAQLAHGLRGPWTPRHREDYEPRYISRASSFLHCESLVAMGLESVTGQRWIRVHDHDSKAISSNDDLGEYEIRTLYRSIRVRYFIQGISTAYLKVREHIVLEYF
ncbi:hypothetical protein TNCV_4606691 [Trichonephila clavipes]|nr:hypothetical protein TNCV_4606691 [Trichonephila clavipes]